ncbi:MAG: hypothetical protein IJK99_02625 [Bacteroidales bacterium]|nr:hypothetical protein [Bacteroidales bacterium]
MKINRWIVVLLGVIALATSVAALCRACDRRVVESECSEVYRRYKDRDDLSVVFVKDYRIGDSITVDVTTIEAKDSTNWDKLLRDLNVHEYTISLNRQYVQEGKSPVSTSYRLKDNPSQKSTDNDNPNNTLMVTAYREQIVYFFSIDSKNQTHNIMDVKLSEIVHNKNQQK